MDSKNDSTSHAGTLWAGSKSPAGSSRSELQTENPFFVPPDEFLREIRERDAPAPLH
jgi:hypothetical protein